MMKIYCLSGLGVDHRAFENIVLPNAELVAVSWIPPLKGESLFEYSRRLFEVVQAEKETIYMGVSFGGMVAQEWARIQTPQKLVLISTTYHPKGIRSFLRIPGKLGFHRFLHPKVATVFFPISCWIFGASKSKDSTMLKTILKDTDPDFLRWATGALLQWN